MNIKASINRINRSTNRLLIAATLMLAMLLATTSCQTETGNRALLGAGGGALAGGILGGGRGAVAGGVIGATLGALTAPSPSVYHAPPPQYY